MKICQGFNTLARAENCALELRDQKKELTGWECFYLYFHLCYHSCYYFFMLWNCSFLTVKLILVTMMKLISSSWEQPLANPTPCRPMFTSEEVVMAVSQGGRSSFTCGLTPPQIFTSTRSCGAPPRSCMYLHPNT